MSAGAPPTFEPIGINVGYMKTERYLFGTSGERQINFAPPLADEPDLLRVPKGVSELTIQARMCGDFYAMIDGPSVRCVSTFAPTLREAVSGLFAQVQP